MYRCSLCSVWLAVTHISKPCAVQRLQLNQPLSLRLRWRIVKDLWMIYMPFAWEGRNGKEMENHDPRKYGAEWNNQMIKSILTAAADVPFWEVRARFYRRFLGIVDYPVTSWVVFYWINIWSESESSCVARCQCESWYRQVHVAWPTPIHGWHLINDMTKKTRAWKFLPLPIPQRRTNEEGRFTSECPACICVTHVDIQQCHLGSSALTVHFPGDVFV